MLSVADVRRSLPFAKAALILALSVPGFALAQTSSVPSGNGLAAPATVKIAYFTKQPVIEMAQKHGFFAAENLTVIEEKTAGSTLLFKNLRDGVWDVGFNVADNDLQFRLNPGNPLHITFPAVIFAAIDNGAGASSWYGHRSRRARTHAARILRSTRQHLVMPTSAIRFSRTSAASSRP